jgi:hypothetical protein
MVKGYLFLVVFLFFVSGVYAAAPILDSIVTPQNLTESVAYTYVVNATDPEGGNVTFSDDTSNFDISRVNGTSALISFTPTNGMVGNFTAVIIVRDAEGLIDAQAVVYIVNGLPSFDNLGDKNVTAGQEFYYNMDATDPEDDSANLNFSSNSSLFTINSSTGEINYTTLISEVAVYSINVTVRDTKNASTSGIFSWAVNDQPNLTTIPNGSAMEDVLFELNISDYINDTVGVLNFTDNSSLFEIGLSSGIINFTPGNADNGSFIINITTFDSYGLFDSELWGLNVTWVNDAPIFSNISNQTSYNGQTFELDINATDEENHTISYYDNSSLFDINISTGLINLSVNSSVLDSYSINITVNDSLGATYSSVFYLTLSNNGAPVFPANQVININVSSDTYVDSQFNNTNYYGADSLRISNLTDSIKRSYLNFSLDQIPSIANISFASLNLTISSELTDANLSLYEVNSSWDETNITFINQPIINITPRANVSSGVAEAMDSFSITDVITSWLAGNCSKYGFSLRLQNDSDSSGNISYYSSDSSNSSKWPHLYVNYSSNIQDQTLAADSTLSDIFDLDNYFYDSDGDQLNYNVTVHDDINVSIDSDNVVSITASSGFSGDASFVFNASDAVNSTLSNSFTITVTSDSSPSTSTSSSGGGGSSKKIASLNIILDVDRQTISKGETMYVPAILQNNGDVTISNLDLSLEANKQGLLLSLTVDSISRLRSDKEEETTLVINAVNPLPGSYIVTFNALASSPDLDESAILVLDVLNEQEELSQELLSAQDFFRNNPECLELQELVDKAGDYLNLGNYDEARSNLDMAMEACKNIIRSPELEKSPSFPSLGKILLFLTLVTIVSVLLYTIFTRLRFKWR